MAQSRSFKSKLAALGAVLLGVTSLCACTPEADAGAPAIDAAPANATPLDLSRNHLPGGDPGTVELADERELLPDLFTEDGEERRVSISGNVITDDTATTLRDRVDGAEVTVEVKTR